MELVEEARRRRMRSLAGMLELTPLLSPRQAGGGPRTPQEQEMLRREVESTDRQIDQLVYELYGLTDEEIGIVEGKERE